MAWIPDMADGPRSAVTRWAPATPKLRAAADSIVSHAPTSTMNMPMTSALGLPAAGRASCDCAGCDVPGEDPTSFTAHTLPAAPDTVREIRHGRLLASRLPWARAERDGR